MIRMISPQLVQKISDDPAVAARLGEQAGYMRQIRELGGMPPIVPLVVAEENAGYTMEKGQPVDFWNIKIPGLFMAMKARLAQTIWKHPPIIPTSIRWTTCLLDYLEPVLLSNQIPEDYVKYLQVLVTRMGFENKWTTAVHGDCTLDNVLLPPGGSLEHDPAKSLWITDPIPPDHRLPSHRTVDLGKMLQSATGWENMKYAGLPAIQHQDCITSVLNGEDEITQQAAWTWCAVHYARILPYAKQPGLTHAVRCSFIRSLGTARQLARRQPANTQKGSNRGH